MSSGPVVLVGAGNMGGAMLRGWLSSGIGAQSIVVIDPAPPPAMQAFLKEQNVAHHLAPPDGITASALIVAVKPQMMSTVLPAFAKLVGKDTVCVSIAAGTSIAELTRHLGDMPIVRAMPNTPAMIGRGITAALPNAHVTGEQHELTNRLLSVCGPVEWVDTEDA
ncbi:MAG: NAD(P)-binding domain-containing protein, partial [Pseudomonadota bacterium]